ncbi:MAG TPA: AraC family transcriptional regulator [Mycobacteriales bacterium]|nr:AraC family transcriptional regulator [Mycobacteriales bacterium]
MDPARGGWVHFYDTAGQPLMRHAHRHDELEVNVVLRGWVDYLIEDRRVRFPRHGLGWLRPDQTHRLIHRAADLQMWIGVFTPAVVASVGAPPGPSGVRIVDAISLGALCERLADPAVTAARHRLGLSWLLSECVQAHQDADGGPAGTRLHPAVQAAARWLHDHAAEPEAGDLHALAQRCGISRPWLSRTFHEQLGESLTEYRNRQRFYRFRELLAGGMSATDAALAAGFGSYAQCFRVVRGLTGRSPRELVRGRS